MLLNCEVRSVQRSESVAPRSLFFQAEDSRSRSLFVGNKDEDAQRSCEALWHQVHLCCRLVQGFLGSFLFFYAYHSLPSWLLPGKRFRILVFFVPARMTSVTDVPLMNSSNEFDHTQGILEWVQICTTSFSSDQIKSRFHSQCCAAYRPIRARKWDEKNAYIFVLRLALTAFWPGGQQAIVCNCRPVQDNLAQFRRVKRLVKIRCIYRMSCTLDSKIV